MLRISTVVVLQVVCTVHMDILSACCCAVELKAVQSWKSWLADQQIITLFNSLDTVSHEFLLATNNYFDYQLIC